MWDKRRSLACPPSRDSTITQVYFAATGLPAATTLRIQFGRPDGLDEPDFYRPVTKINRIILRRAVIRAKAERGASQSGGEWVDGRDGCRAEMDGVGGGTAQ